MQLKNIYLDKRARHHRAALHLSSGLPLSEYLINSPLSEVSFLSLLKASDELSLGAGLMPSITLSLLPHGNFEIHLDDGLVLRFRRGPAIVKMVASR